MSYYSINNSKVFTFALKMSNKLLVNNTIYRLTNVRFYKTTSSITLVNNRSNSKRCFSHNNNSKNINFSHLKRFRGLPLICQRSIDSSIGRSYSNTNNDIVSSSSDDQKKPKELSLPEKIVESAPESWQPYLKLSRMHRPIGTWLLFWPCTWGLALGSQAIPSLATLSLFGIGAFIMRGAGCTINDMWDRHIDAKVRRTADRPLACGQLRMRHAAAWLGSQLSIALVILCQLNSPCFILGVGSLGLVILYPLAKRVTHWPQAVLGLTFNTGIIMGYTATQSKTLGYLATPWLDPSCLAFYLSGLSWTLIYDTIYAHQDKEDDALLGLGSTARKFGDNTKYWLSGFTVAMISSLSAAGIASDLSWPFYVGVAATASHLIWQIKTLDINNHQNCADRFTSNRNIGWLIFLSLIGAYSWDNYLNSSATTQVAKAELSA